MPYDLITVEDADSWQYSLIGKKNGVGRKIVLDENKRICSKKNAKYHLVYFVNYVSAPDPEEESESGEDEEEESEDSAD